VIDHAWPWLLRTLPIVAAAVVASLFRAQLGFWLTGTATAFLLLLYIWRMRPLYGPVLALDPRWTRWFAALKLVPSEAPSAAPVVNQL
jgi:hypothetical protein